MVDSELATDYLKPCQGVMQGGGEKGACRGKVSAVFSGKKVPGKGWSRGAYIGPCSIVRVAYRVVVKEHVKGCVRSMQGDNVGEMQGGMQGTNIGGMQGSSVGAGGHAGVGQEVCKGPLC